MQCKRHKVEARIARWPFSIRSDGVVTLAYMGAPDSCSVRQQISRVPRLVRDKLHFCQTKPPEIMVRRLDGNGTRDGRARTPYIRRADSLPWAGRTDGWDQLGGGGGDPSTG